MNTKSNLLRAVLLLAFIAVQGFTPAMALASPAQSAATGATSMPADLYQAVLNSTAQINSSLQFSNGTYPFNADGLNAALSSSGLALSAQKGSSWNWDVQVNGFGRGANPQAISAANRSESKNGTATLHYPGFSEWMRRTGIGLEQGFTVDQSPQGNGMLILRMGLNTNLSGNLSKDSRSLSFDTGDGKTLYYSNLRVFDAKGKELDARLVYTPKQIIIQVDDASGVYPLTVDPLIYFETKIVAVGGAANDYFGWSAAISGDTAIVGASGYNSNQGAAYIFQRSGLTWAQLAELTASDSTGGDEFGDSVAIDGDTAIVGASAYNGQGKAYVFVKPYSGWADATESAGLSASSPAASARFGYSVAISGDTAIVGSYGKMVSSHSNQGAAYIFVKPVGGWTGNLTETASLTASDGVANDWFGWSVAISGNSAIVGALVHNSNQGAAYIFVKPDGGWTGSLTETAGLTAWDGLGGDHFGNSVAISGDTAIVGARDKASGAGKAYIFVKPTWGWGTTSTFTAGLTASEGAANDNFGYSVAISGGTAIVGAPGRTSNQGKAYVFVKPVGGWATTSTPTAPLTASDGASSDKFGNAVAISEDTAIVGAWNKNGSQGAAYFYYPNRNDQDLAIGAAASSAAPGYNMIFTASVTNYGPSPAPTVLVSAPLPSGFTFVKAAPTFGSYDASTGSWDVGSLAVGITATLSIQATVPSSAAGTSLTFTASLLGSDTNNSNNSASVSLHVPLLSFSPTPLAFGSQKVGTASVAQTVTVTNVSDYDVPLGLLTVPSAVFVLSTSTCTHVTLDAFGTCSFKVQFKPTSPIAYAGNISLQTLNPSDTATLPVSGIGATTKQLLTNRSFEIDQNRDGIPDGWSQNGSTWGGDGRDCTVSSLGRCSLMFIGANAPKQLSFTVNKSGVAGDKYVFGVAAKGASVGGTLDAKIHIYNGLDEYPYQSLFFPTGTYAFMKSTLSFAMTGPYTRLVVVLDYTGPSATTAWFDNASLVWMP